MEYQYPIGRPEIPDEIRMEHIEKWVEDIAAAPDLIRKAVQGLNEKQLDTPYRPEGWTVRQVVHHLADSHMVTYLNFRSGLLGQDVPMRTGDVNGWAMTKDYLTGDVTTSVDALDALHRRWVTLLETMSDEDFKRNMIAANGSQRSLGTLLAIYAWHGRHHVAHITELRSRMGW